MAEGEGGAGSSAYGSWISGGAGVATGAIGAISTARQGSKNREFARQENKYNREFQMYMSNTAHRREQADLLAAGLNPILTATGGPGAAMGSGSSMGAGIPQNKVDGESMIRGGISAAKAGLERTLLKKQIDLTKQNEKTAEKLAMKYNYDGNKAHSEMLRAHWQTKILQEQHPGWKIEGEIDRGKLGDYTRRANRVTGAVSGAAKAVEPFLRRRTLTIKKTGAGKPKKGNRPQSRRK